MFPFLIRTSKFYNIKVNINPPSGAVVSETTFGALDLRDRTLVNRFFFQMRSRLPFCFVCKLKQKYFCMINYIRGEKRPFQKIKKIIRAQRAMISQH